MIDIKNDDKVDIFNSGRPTDEITTQKNIDGLESGKNIPLTVILNYSNSIHTADLDDDGGNNVPGTAMDDNEVTWWENNIVNSGP